jgi:hypothetical protein
MIAKDQKNSLQAKAPEALLKAQHTANMLDTAVKIPIIGVQFGLDAVLGLIPGLGDAVMFLASFRILRMGRKLGLPKALQTAMVRNSLIDFGLGLIPVVGDIADIFYKSNQKNVRIIERWWIKQNKAKVDALAKQKLTEWEQQQE